MALPAAVTPPRAFDAVLFDLDATLLDTEEALDATIASYLSSRYGVTVTKAQLEVRGAPWGG